MAYEKIKGMDTWFTDIIKEGEKMKKIYISPQVIEDGNQYKKHLVEWMDLLKKDFKEKAVDSSYLDTIDELGSKLIYILDKYHEGNIGAAYEKMKDIILPMKEESVGLAVSSIQKSFAFNDLEAVLKNSIQNNQIEFFRARTSDKYCIFNREEMLHVPFNMRERVSSSRFSIPGLPCLYLATTSYCCWLELKTPPDYQFNVSPVKINQERKILNLTMTTSILEEIMKWKEESMPGNKYIIEALKLWILSYASSFKIRDENRVFKEEYIIPQLIMLVSRDLGLDGVSYYSKQVEDDRFAHMISVNLALFAKYNGEKRFSEICSDIEIAPSYNYAMYKQLQYGAKYNNYCDKLHINDSSCLKNVGSFRRQNEYRHTEFYEFDRYLFFGIAPEIEKINLEVENN